MPLRVAPPPAWARAVRTCPTVAAAEFAALYGVASAAPAQGASDAFARGSARRPGTHVLCRRPDVLEERAQASFRLSLALALCLVQSRSDYFVDRSTNGIEGNSPSGAVFLSFAFILRHRMRQGYPLNLSISLSGGEETNQDAPSNGE